MFHSNAINTKHVQLESTCNSLGPSDAYMCQKTLSILILEMICSRYGLAPVQHQAITWTNADLLSIGLDPYEHILHHCHISQGTMS